MNYRSATSYICARCSDSCGSCCILKPGLGSYHIFISDHEASLILKQTGNRYEIFDEIENHKLFISYMNSLFPDLPEEVKKTFPDGGTHRTLALDNSGRCSLLTEKGCSLPDQCKPLFCRLYPFWFIKGRLTSFSSKKCLAIAETNNLEELTEIFMTRENMLRGIYKMLCSSWLDVTP